MKLRAKLLLTSTGSMVTLAAILLTSGIWMSYRTCSSAGDEILTAANAELRHLSTMALDMVAGNNESIRTRNEHNMMIAKRMMKTLDNASADEVAKLTGECVSVLQTAGSEGDMRCVATSILDKDGKRAVGTRTPAMLPDGKPNPVISALKSGAPYEGVSYTAGKWYVARYEPIKNSSGQVTGALFVGVEQESIPGIRRGIMSPTLGKSGYIWVVSARSETPGRYVISKGGKRDGENILNTKDATGRYCIKEMIALGTKHPDGKPVFYNYMWVDKGKTTARKKIVAMTYYEPWGWLIGASAYEDEYLAPITSIRASTIRMGWLLIFLGLAITGIASGVFGIVASKISNKIKRLTTVAEAMSVGDVASADKLLEEEKAA